MSTRLITEEIEVKAEFSGRVVGSNIVTDNSLDDYKGQNVIIIIPEEESYYSVLTNKEVRLLLEKVEIIKFPNPYSKQRKEEVIKYLKDILKYPDGFPEEYIYKIYSTFKNLKDVKDIVKKIKEGYGF